MVNQSYQVTNCNPKVFSLLNLKLEMKPQCGYMNFGNQQKTQPFHYLFQHFFQVIFSALLPLLPKSVNSTVTVRHCITVICKIIEHVNPGQSLVITGNQPVYALRKQIQFMYSLKFDKVISMMGSLHIEMAFISAIGDCFEWSGWIDVLKDQK